MYGVPDYEGHNLLRFHTYLIKVQTKAMFVLQTLTGFNPYVHVLQSGRYWIPDHLSLGTDAFSRCTDEYRLDMRRRIDVLNNT